MSAILFIEALSTDPVERAIAARVARILSNPRLSATQRREQVQQAQQALLAHRRQRAANPQTASSPKRIQRGAAMDPIAARRKELGRPPTGEAVKLPRGKTRDCWLKRMGSVEPIRTNTGFSRATT